MILLKSAIPSRIDTKKRCSFHHRGLECKLRKQCKLISGKFELGVQNEAGQRLIQFCQKNTLVIANTLFQQQRRPSTLEYHQMVNTEIRLVIFFAAEDGVQFSCSVMSDSLRTHELQHVRPSCPSPTPGVHPNPCALSK